ncbi:MAG: hypothetical protein ACU833_14355 [Gammaproteobacteria bacterium]
MNSLIEKAKRLFGNLPRPEHFTDYRHCCECAEHDRTLRAHDPDTIGLEALGNPGWDPMCFATGEAFRYYFPAMVRLALEGTGGAYYSDQFLFHLTCGGCRNRRWQGFSPEQRRFVVEVLNALQENRAEEIERCFNADDLLKAVEIWSDVGA